MSLLHALPGAALPFDEAALTALGVHRIEVPVPFLEAGGPANVLAIEGQGGALTLFDTGVGNEEGLAALRSGLSSRGLDLRRVNQVVVSHGHVDHYGNAQTIAEESGATIHVHPADLTKILGQERWSHTLQANRPFFLELGVPPEVLDELLARTRASTPMARPVERSRIALLEVGQRLDFARFSAQVLHCPGHTPGLICLWAQADKLLFADDHVLARVSPNPLLDFSMGQGAQRFRALVAYLESARRVMAMELDAVVPGHGASFSQHRPLLEGLLLFYERRQEMLLARLREVGPQTVYALLPAIFRRIDRSRLYLMLSEVLGNLEVLEASGRVKVAAGAWSAA